MINIAEPIKTELSLDRALNRTYTSTYQVITDFEDNPASVLNASGFPGYFLPYTWGGISDPYAYLDSVKITPRSTDIGSDDQTERYRIWDGVVVHSTKVDPRTSQQPRLSPVFEPPVIRGSFLGYTEPVYRDKDNKPITNSAFEPVNPPFQKENAHDSLSLSYNTPYISLAFRSFCRNKVNSAPIWGLAARQVKLMGWGYEVLYNGGFSYIKNSLEFLISTVEHPPSCDFPSGVIGWYDTYANMGHSQLVSGKQKPILVNDVKKKEPSYLACDGTVVDPTTTNETYRTKAIEKEADFRLIPGLPLYLPGPFV